MFRILFICVLSILLIPSLLFAETLDLLDAVDKGKLECRISGNPESSHYHKALLFHLKNLDGGELSVSIPAGLQLASVDTFTQDFIVTGSDLIVLAPGEKRSIEIYACCTQPDNGGPLAEDLFTLNGMAEPELLKLTQFIDKMGFHNFEAQDAIWAYVENDDLESITYGWAWEASDTLIAILAELMDQPKPEPPSEEDYERNLHSQNMSVKVQGRVDYMFTYETDVTIALFNEAGVVVRELYHNDALKPGEHSLKFAFDASVYSDPVYYVRLISNEQIELEMRMDL